MNNTNTTMNSIIAMMMNKYRENETTTVLKARIEINEYTHNVTYENLHALLTWCSKRRKAYSAMHDFYNKYHGWNKANSAWSRWKSYTNLINACFYYTDLYALKNESSDYYKSLSYRIIKEGLTSL